MIPAVDRPCDEQLGGADRNYLVNFDLRNVIHKSLGEGSVGVVRVHAVADVRAVVLVSQVNNLNIIKQLCNFHLGPESVEH